MTDLYDERIDAMKARERDGGVRWESTDLYGIMTLPEIIEMIWSGRRYEQESRNITRLAAYQRKRLAHDAFNIYDAAMTAKGLV